jgi:Zn-finger protein
MDDLTKRCIKERIKIILNEFDYKNRKEKHPEECPCYGGNPCHDMEDLNCFLCYCPWYNLEVSEGGCKLNNPLEKGQWFERKGHYISDRIWDCSNCTYPHNKKVIKKELTKLLYGKTQI